MIASEYPPESNNPEVAALAAQLSSFEAMFERSRLLAGSEVRDGLPIPRLEVELLEEAEDQHFVWRYSLVIGRGQRLRRSIALEIAEQSLSPNRTDRMRDPSAHIPHQLSWRSDAEELGIPAVLVVGDSVIPLRAGNDA